MTNSSWHAARRGTVSLLCVWTLLVSVGCGGSDSPKMVRVSGTVQRAGRPVGSLWVFFEPSSTKGQTSAGKTDADGKFTLTQSKDKSGAIVGTHKVYFQYAAPTPNDEIAYQEGTLKLPADLEEVITKFGSAETSTLKVEVSDKDPQSIEIKIE